jgi:hypothetical protein
VGGNTIAWGDPIQTTGQYSGTLFRIIALRPERRLLIIVVIVVLQPTRDAWKDLGNIMLEERWRIEERKEIIGEEWRKISRILDR